MAVDANDPDACKYCHGKGVYIVKETYTDGDEVLMPRECNHCHGTGRTDGAVDGAGDFDADEGDDDE